MVATNVGSINNLTIPIENGGTLQFTNAVNFSDAVTITNGGTLAFAGDSLLVVFGSIDGAIRCAVRLQEQAPSHDGDLQPDRAMRFRIGINIGDAIADGTDLHGDAVNVAVRLQAECPPGAICISRSVRDHVHARLKLEFGGAWAPQTEEYRSTNRSFRDSTRRPLSREAAGRCCC